MAEEIERKFLVDHLEWSSDPDIDAQDIEQGYLCADKEKSVRVRIRGDDATFTIKGATEGITRKEFEYPLPIDDAKALLELCGDTRVSKRRYNVRFAGRDWEVDVFSGKNSGLVVAEIELEDAGEDFEKPSWIGREVSDDPRYYNSNLAQKPYSEWED